MARVVLVDNTGHPYRSRKEAELTLDDHVMALSRQEMALLVEWYLREAYGREILLEGTPAYVAEEASVNEQRKVWQNEIRLWLEPGKQLPLRGEEPPPPEAGSPAPRRGPPKGPVAAAEAIPVIKELVVQKARGR